LASTGAHKRAGLRVAASAARRAGALSLVSLLCMLALPAAGAQAANVGGTPAAGAPAAQTPVTAKSTKPVKGQAGTVRLSGAICAPAAHCSGNPRQVSVHGTLQLTGAGLRAGMLVVFPSYPGALIGRTSPGSHLRLYNGTLIVTVPKNAHSGRIMVLIDRTRHTGSYGPITIFSHALHPPRPPAPRYVPPTSVTPAGASPFDGQGMWIWYVEHSNHGSVASIVAQAHAAGVTTLFIKSSDGASNYWGQFSPQLVAELHANGLKACAWQYVYGSNPRGEAALGAEAAANGADCLVIDAESEYEGHYAAAQTYIAELRAKVGPSYPIGLASFPYVSYHPSEPFSVFLGPGGAQYNAPQTYWKDIGVSVDTVYANTYIANRIYGRPIFPLGQTYGGVSYSDLLRFREEAIDYGAGGWSFWDWQETGSREWAALAAPLAPLSSVTPNTEYPELSQGAKGDQVLWLQEHLASAVPAQPTTGIFSSQTAANLSAFQTAHGIAASGVATPETWVALLALPPVAVNWTGGGPAG
jgi:peptidoglycan hydrolase-like protein with peptidoglycan-binding domain